MTMKERKSLGHRILRVLVWMLLPYLMLGAFYLLVVFRLQLRPINDGVRVFNKRLLNPVMMAVDRRHWYAAVLKHKGRRSGKEYATPVTVARWDAQKTASSYPFPMEKRSTGSRTCEQLVVVRSKLGAALM